MDLLELYSEYVRPLKGSARYHRWSFLTCVAGLLERRVWFDKGRFGVMFPNMYTILVGPPAAGKSTAAQMMVDFFGAVTSPGKKGPHLGPTKITQAALYKELKDAERITHVAGQVKHSPMFIFASELAINMMDFGGGTLTNELIDFYDSKGLSASVAKRTIGDGMLTLFNPSITLLGCTTASFLQQAARDKLITSGLASRIVFVVEPNRVEKQRNEVKLDKLAFKSIIAELNRVYALRGPVTITPEAGSMLWGAAETADDACWAAIGDLNQNYYGRKTDHIVKISMVLAASRGTLKVELKDVLDAINMLEELEPDMVKAFGTRAIDNDEDLSYQITSHIPLEPNWISRAELLTTLMRNGKFLPMSQSFDSTMSTLITTGTVIAQEIGNDKLYTRRKDAA
jgi:hypothetical protein